MNKNKKIIFIIAIIIIIATVLIVKVIAENSSYAPEIKVTDYNGNKKTLVEGNEVTMCSTSAFTYEENPNVFCTEKDTDFAYWNTTYKVSKYYEVKDAKLAYILNIDNSVGKNGYHYSGRGSKNNTKQRLLWYYITNEPETNNNVTEDKKRLKGDNYKGYKQDVADLTQQDIGEELKANEYRYKLQDLAVEITNISISRK